MIAHRTEILDNIGSGLMVSVTNKVSSGIEKLNEPGLPSGPIQRTVGVRLALTHVIGLFVESLS